MKRFKKVYIEITNVCNLSCNFCPKTNRQLKYMTESEFKHVITEIKPVTDYVYLHVMGEPLAHKKLKEFLHICEGEGLKVNLTTNGTLIAPMKEVLLHSNALRQINFSIHSFEANQCTPTLKKYLKEIADFILEAHETTNIISSIRLWNMDFEDLKADNQLNNEILEAIEELLQVEFSIKDRLTNQMSTKLMDRVYINMAHKFEWPNMHREILHEEAFCYGLRDQIGILVNGTVVPCCLDSEGNIILGNIFQNPLVDILNSERAVNLYEGFSNRCAVEDLCKRCGYVKRYHKK